MLLQKQIHIKKSNMKKIILSAAFIALLGGASIVKAQSTEPVSGNTSTPGVQPPSTSPSNGATQPGISNPGTPATTPATTSGAAGAAESKTAVKIDELPEAVKTTLKSDAVKDWTAVDAVSVKGATGEYYQINLKKGDDLRFVRLDKDGRPVKSE